MIDVHYPKPEFRIKTENGDQYIFDQIRKGWLLLTEEEWVRQNFIGYLTKQLQYPSTMIALEKEIKLHDLKKRFDILIYDAKHKPWMLVECKASHIELTENVLQQILRYNISVPVQFILITNGKSTMGWQKIGPELKLLDKLPDWN